VLENIFGTSTRRVNIDQMDPIEVEPTYQGPHLTFPITIDNVMLMLEHFKRGSVLHIKVRIASHRYHTGHPSPVAPHTLLASRSRLGMIVTFIVTLFGCLLHTPF
jgi:hypothetical protein